jgi:hypothetical protein
MGLVLFGDNIATLDAKLLVCRNFVQRIWRENPVVKVWKLAARLALKGGQPTGFALLIPNKAATSTSA